MQKYIKLILLFTIGVIFLVLPYRPALAYLDPGTGSILLQGIIAVLSTVMASVLVGWRYVKKAVASLWNRHTPSDKGSA